MQPDLECTLWPEGWWGHCCIAHDLGASDADLAVCVIQSAPNVLWGAFIAFVMIAGLALFRPIYMAIVKARNDR
jgi:hypothetical protein